MVKVRVAVANGWKEHGLKTTWMPTWQDMTEPQGLFSFDESKLMVSQGRRIRVHVQSKAEIDLLLV